MIETITKILDFLIANYALYMVVTMSLIISLTICLLTFIKKPIKKLTSKIENERLRKLSNKTLIVIAFGLSAIIWLFLHLIMPKYFDFELQSVLISAAFSIVVHALGDGVITQGAAKNLINEIIVDVSENKKEKPIKEKKSEQHSAVTDFLKKVK